MVKTIKVSNETHAQLVQLAKWGETLEEVILKHIVGKISDRKDLNVTEGKAYRWLAMTPSNLPLRRVRKADFMTPDGRLFEVKRLYKNRGGRRWIQFTHSQMKRYDVLNPTIIVFSDSDEPIIECLFSEIESKAKDFRIEVLAQGPY